MPRQRFAGQTLIDFLLSQGYERCPDPEGPPTGTIALSTNCADRRAVVLLVHATVELGAVYAETVLAKAGINTNEFWRYLEFL